MAIILMGQKRDLIRPATLFALGAGLAWPVVITLGYFAEHASLTAMLSDWIWPLQHYSAANHVPYGYQDWSESTVHLLFGTGSLFTRFVAGLVVSPCFVIPVLPLVALALLVHWTVRTCGGKWNGCKIFLLCSCQCDAGWAAAFSCFHSC